jgi:prepilin-type N-terminal cleavage/methylation domain-containing protein
MVGKQRRYGFTIVELLIVIVVIGILAAIVIVAYSGVQARAKNSAIIQSAESVQKLIASYKITNGDNYPVTPDAARCLTVDNHCTDYQPIALTTSNVDLITALRTIGTPPSQVPDTNSSYYGLYLDLFGPRTYNGSVKPGLMMYNLIGNNLKCGLSDVVEFDSSGPGPNPFKTSTTGYTYSGGGITQCWVSV